VEGKADGLHAPEGSSPGGVIGEDLGHHRGLRAGHVFRGVSRERGRATTLLGSYRIGEPVYKISEPSGVAWSWDLAGSQ
jgi:hypothetical protein